MRIDQVRAAVPGVGDEDMIPARVWWGLPSTTAIDMAWSLPLLGDVGEDMARALYDRCLAFVKDICGKSRTGSYTNLWFFHIAVVNALGDISGGDDRRIFGTSSEDAFCVADATLFCVLLVPKLKERCSTDEERAAVADILQAAETAPFVLRTGFDPQRSDSYDCPLLWELLTAAEAETE